MRQVVLDTETTGIGHELGHRVIEIGCVELINRKLTGKTFHTYLNPQRTVDDGAFRVHGISTEFLDDKPLFKDIIKEFVHFIKDAQLIIHNAPFDVGFLNAEFKRAKWPSCIDDHSTVLDTLVLARQKHPGQRNSLDALCKRYDVNNSNRQLHGALLDAEILAFVYLAMTGGQRKLFADDIVATSHIKSLPEELSSLSPVVMAGEDDLQRHGDFIRFLIKKAGVDYWND
jgi:DNA polymerase-3 subunit epsilon